MTSNGLRNSGNLTSETVRFDSDYAVRATGVSKSFVRSEVPFIALSRVNMHLRVGEFVSLVGPSGCGKSTMLRIIGGLLRATTGEVSVSGQPVRKPRRDVGIMFQEPTLFPWRTVLENALLPIEIQRKPSADDTERARELLSLVGLDQFMDHYPRELSGGMQQRVALSRVLMVQPRLMLLDEPFGALDEFTREGLNQELAELTTRAQVSVILVTHSIPEAVFLGDRVIAMGTHPGRILGEVSVPLARPRSISLLRTPELQVIVSRVREVLGIDGHK